MKEIRYETTSIKKKVTKLLSSVTKARQYCLAKDAQTRQREVEIQLVKEREKTLHRNLALVKKELAGVNVENASLRRSLGNVDDKTESLDRQNVTQVAQSVDAAFSGHLKQLMEQARWTNAQNSNDLKTSVTLLKACIFRKVAKCVATLSNQLNAIMAVGSEVASSRKPKNINEMSEDADAKSAEGGAGPGSDGGSSG